MTAYNQLPDLSPALPELFLAGGALALLMLGVFGGRTAVRYVTALSVALLAVAALPLLLPAQFGITSASTFHGAFVLDGFAIYLKILTLIGSGFAIAMSVAFARNENFEHFEYPVLILLATLGMMLMLSANDMIILYLGLELQSLALYVIAAFNRDSVRSTEAGLKYFVLGSVSSGMLLYGMSLVYGFTGNTGFPEIAAAITAQGGSSLGLVFGLVFILAGLAFKVSAVPFHMWTPDVYEGAPTPVTAFFAAAPKIAAMGMLTRIVIDAFEPVTHDWQQIIVFVSIASMALGAFAAIGQRNIKRLMAYSSIGHMGFALVGLAAGTQAGVEGVVIYMTAYLAMTLGAFACILSMRRKEGMVEEISDLSGLARTNLPMAVLLGIILFSLAGIPPFIGFFAKFYVFLAAVEAGLYPLAIIGILSSVVGAYYYLRIVKVMFFDEPARAFLPMPVELKFTLGLSSVFVMFFVVFAGSIVEMAAAAAGTLF
ncbi:NADH-quinone oxidoreductase subunit NuoN [Stappia stellulata]|uniref:NADH-quinone oxidoreductase subunit NuoN n=1 Tax=Stappia stellulata TaxID=71235 RepID=UPI0004135F7F|nr:NADH-quinone oxidoreductase subunit NuoN [Stappia stellulata]